ncbi:MAG: sigma 54-interacting transcriptional regulator, partial [Eubacteriales bacterium]
MALQNEVAWNKERTINETSVLNSLHNAVIAVDHQGRIVIYNPACERILGVPAEKALGRLVSEMIPYTGLLKVLKTGKAHIGRKFIAGNSVYMVNRTPIIWDGAVVGAIGVLQDITELQHIAEELQLVKELKGALETVFDSGSDGYVVINNDGVVTLINRALAELLEVEPDQAIGRHITELVPETGLHLVPHSKKPHAGEIMRLNGKDAVVMRWPIQQNGRTIGAMSKVIFKDIDRLAVLVGKVDSLNKELSYYKSELERYQSARYTVDSLIGSSPLILELKETTRRVAAGPSTVMILGESGTGKEILAHALHNGSNRRNGPFVKVNCAAMPENLLESELFGYQEGAFTGAKKGGQVGKFERASGGTIFLDEIGDMTLTMQAKLLRVLQEKEIERLGDSKPLKVDVRVIAATNCELEELIREGRFREDLYYRLNVVTLHLPPLRDRIEDLRPLCAHFIEKFNREFSLSITDLVPEVWDSFYGYPWPGNVRELENVIERAFNLVGGPVITVADLPLYFQKHGKGKRLAAHKTLPSLLEEVEKEAVR